MAPLRNPPPQSLRHPSLVLSSRRLTEAAARTEANQQNQYRDERHYPSLGLEAIFHLGSIASRLIRLLQPKLCQ